MHRFQPTVDDFMDCTFLPYERCVRPEQKAEAARAQGSRVAAPSLAQQSHRGHRHVMARGGESRARPSTLVARHMRRLGAEVLQPPGCSGPVVGPRQSLQHGQVHAGADSTGPRRAGSGLCVWPHPTPPSTRHRVRKGCKELAAGRVQAIGPELSASGCCPGQHPEPSPHLCT